VNAEKVHLEVGHERGGHDGAGRDGSETLLRAHDVEHVAAAIAVPAKIELS